MKKLKTKRKSLITEYGKYDLVYELLVSNDNLEGEKNWTGDYFGIRILQFKEDGSLFDCEEALGITEDSREAERLFYQYVDGLVMPVHLLELVDERDPVALN